MALKSKTTKKTAAPAKKQASGKTVSRKPAKAPVKKDSTAKTVTAQTKPVKEMQIPPVKKAELLKEYTNVFKLPKLDINEMETIMNKQNFQFDQITNEATSTGRECMDACMKSSTIFAKGVEDIIRTAMSLTQDAAEKQAEMIKQMMSAKTLNEFTAAQSKITQASFDQFMANATKLSEMSAKVLGDAAAPFNEQMAKTMKKTTKMAA